MKIINTGNAYQFYGDNIKTFNQLPAGSYSVGFSPKQGFFLVDAENFVINEKIYGTHEKKVEKVFRTYNVTQRNLGVILSGDKGIGKSLFAKLLSIKAISNGLPLIIVNSYIPGIADFLNGINQRCVILFDEFDKTFCGKNGDRNTAMDPQTEMLTLFDGINSSEKLFVITCNSLGSLSEFIINRPGRFHYHFRFDYPSNEELIEYLQDHIAQEYWGEIEAVVKFATRVRLNFDCLRSIAFELNAGETFKEAILDLNIMNFGEERQYYKTIFTFSDGTKITLPKIYFDMFNDEPVTISECDFGVYSDCVSIIFNPRDFEADGRTFCSVITNPDVITTKWDFWNDDGGEKWANIHKTVEENDIKCVKIECIRNYLDNKYYYKMV